MHCTKSTRGRRPETGNQNPLQLRSAPGIYSHPERITRVELEKRGREFPLHYPEGATTSLAGDSKSEGMNQLAGALDIG